MDGALLILHFGRYRSADGANDRTGELIVLDPFGGKGWNRVQLIFRRTGSSRLGNQGFKIRLPEKRHQGFARQNALLPLRLRQQ